MMISFDFVCKIEGGGAGRSTAFNFEGKVLFDKLREFDRITVYSQEVSQSYVFLRIIYPL